MNYSTILASILGGYQIALTRPTKSPWSRVMLSPPRLGPAWTLTSAHAIFACSSRNTGFHSTTGSFRPAVFQHTGSGSFRVPIIEREHQTYRGAWGPRLSVYAGDVEIKLRTLLFCYCNYLCNMYPSTIRHPHLRSRKTGVSKISTFWAVL
ncbi:hypothetical protein EJ08DRAFT_58132 [Tothia fuscella]|uniref:Uncharacterized protein n=1 Tax=Tothia fuscella TaxID=1048955 RepID=A0A9P4U214_9PEZI|nr:hypothetical protein EJ08DRAFT_58132 [Tothia fuscella]